MRSAWNVSIVSHYHFPRHVETFNSFDIDQYQRNMLALCSSPALYFMVDGNFVCVYCFFFLSTILFLLFWTIISWSYHENNVLIQAIRKISTRTGRYFVRTAEVFRMSWPQYHKRLPIETVVFKCFGLILWQAFANLSACDSDMSTPATPAYCWIRVFEAPCNVEQILSCTLSLVKLDPRLLTMPDTPPPPMVFPSNDEIPKGDGTSSPDGPEDNAELSSDFANMEDAASSEAPVDPPIKAENKSAPSVAVGESDDDGDTSKLSLLPPKVGKPLVLLIRLALLPSLFSRNSCPYKSTALSSPIKAADRASWVASLYCSKDKRALALRYKARARTAGLNPFCVAIMIT
mmetsp:Transcript_4994/g.13954  ORF Transcript_4994/g.13954 Transcript_4994/m.13954 type:complete len:347 (-) Transcript_4994:1373-2413(-)